VCPSLFTTNWHEVCVSLLKWSVRFDILHIFFETRLAPINR
jgi:hypothetical protein